MRSPCPDRCTCHSAGPSTLPLPTSKPPRTTSPSTWNRTAPALLLAALAAPALAAPARPTPNLAFLYPTLARRVTDAGQAPDDPSSGWFTPQNIEVEDLVSAGLPMKFVFDPKARPDKHSNPDTVEEIRKKDGAWVVDDYWELHGKRYGPHSVTVDVTDDPLPTPTESASSATPTSSATSTSTTIPSLLAIKSSLPTGWGDPEYRKSGIYSIPIVVSFAVVIALMIGALIGALVYRRGQRRKRRRQKEKLAAATDGDDDASEHSLREKTVRKSLTARVGRVLRAVHTSELRRRNNRHHPNSQPSELAPADAEQGEQQVEQARETSERSDLERRVRSWARRSAVWRVQARVGMRRRIGRGQRRGVDAAADGDDDNGAPVVSRASTRPTSPTPSIPRSRTSQEERRPTVTVVTNTTDQEAAVTPTYATPTVPVYSSGSGSQPGSSTTTSATPTTSHDAHPDATPGDEPAYEYGSGLPPAYRRGEGMTEVRRGKMPMREVDDNEEGEGQDAEGTPVEGRGETDREGGGRRGWTALDAYAFSHEEGGEAAVTAHVATDDKQVLERLRGMRGAPEQVEPRVGEAPREEDVFGVEVEDQQVGEADVVGGSRAFPPPPGSQTRVLPREDEAGLPSPPAKTGAGAVARYGEADLSLPGYLEGAGHSDLGPSAPPDEVGPSAPPEELGPSAPPVDLEPSAPPIDDEPVLSGPSAPPESELLKPSAPPLEEDQVSLIPDMPHFERLNSSTPLLENDHR